MGTGLNSGACQTQRTVGAAQQAESYLGERASSRPWCHKLGLVPLHRCFELRHPRTQFSAKNTTAHLRYKLGLALQPQMRHSEAALILSTQCTLPSPGMLTSGPSGAKFYSFRSSVRQTYKTTAPRHPERRQAPYQELWSVEHRRHQQQREEQTVEEAAVAVVAVVTAHGLRWNAQAHCPLLLHCEELGQERTTQHRQRYAASIPARERATQMDKTDTVFAKHRAIPVPPSSFCRW